MSNLKTSDPARYQKILKLAGISSVFQQLLDRYQKKRINPDQWRNFMKNFTNFTGAIVNGNNMKQQIASIQRIYEGAYPALARQDKGLLDANRMNSFDAQDMLDGAIPLKTLFERRYGDFNGSFDAPQPPPQPPQPSQSAMQQILNPPVNNVARLNAPSVNNPQSSQMSRPVSITNSYVQDMTRNVRNPILKEYRMQNIQPTTTTFKSKTNGITYFQKPPRYDAQVLRKNQMFKGGRQGLYNRLSQDAIKIGQKLQMFPQWTLKLAQNASRQANNLAALNQVSRNLKNPDNVMLSKLSQVDQNISWDSQNNTWHGKGIFDSVIKKTQNEMDDKTVQRVQRSSQLLNQQADQAMINNNVPAIVRILKQSNEQLSNAGFGPRKPGGMPLYVGRWIDPVTGSVRIFPKADQKFINPLSRNQKIAFLQAKIMNKWNQFVQTTQQYLKVNTTTDRQFRERAIKKIQYPETNKGFINLTWMKTLKQIKSMAIDDFVGKPQKQYVIQFLNLSQLADAFVNYYQKDDWQGWIDYISPLLKRVVQSLDFKNPEKQKFNAKILRYISSLVDSQSNSVKRASKMLAKAVSIPQNVNPTQWERVIDIYNQNVQMAKQQLEKSTISLSKTNNLIAPQSADKLQRGNIQSFINMNQGYNSQRLVPSQAYATLEKRLNPKWKTLTTGVPVSNTVKFYLQRIGADTQQKINRYLKIAQELQKQGKLNWGNFSTQAAASDNQVNRMQLQ